MDKLIIRGKRKLHGEVIVSGSKNATLPIMAACLLTSGKTILKNVPNLIDIKTMSHLLRILGAQIEHEKNVMKIDTSHCNYHEAPYELVSKMRASIYVLGPLVSRLGKACVSLPGGCAIGTRPVDLHIEALKKLGVDLKIKRGYIHAKANRLKGEVIFFDKSSVGATATALMTSVLASGTTIIKNASIEPEIDSLVEFLIKMGADVKGKGTCELEVNGVSKLEPVEMEMIADRIEAGTFLIASALTQSPFKIKNCRPDHLSSLIDSLNKSGFVFSSDAKSMILHPAKKIKPVNIITAPYPGFPTDLQAQFTALMSIAEGDCFVEDRIFPERFNHVAELNRLGTDIVVERNIALIKGQSKENLCGAEVMATDLRASAALVLAGTVSEGTTTISRVYHIDRGYENIEKKLTALGADIERVHS